jgi:hypothetical protein
MLIILIVCFHQEKIQRINRNKLAISMVHAKDKVGSYGIRVLERADALLSSGHWYGLLTLRSTDIDVIIMQ